LKPVAPEAIHLTLHFLGNLEREQQQQLITEADQALDDVPSFTVRANGVGAFPSLSRPQVIWAGVERSDALEDLHRRLARAISSAGIAVEDRPFTPHLTLTRLRTRPSAQAARRIKDWSNGWTDQAFGVIPVELVLLYHSQLGAGPARHTAVKSFRLK
jgi:2'-5' RNA ligase